MNAPVEAVLVFHGCVGHPRAGEGTKPSVLAPGQSELAHHWVGTGEACREHAGRAAFVGGERVIHPGERRVPFDGLAADLAAEGPEETSRRESAEVEGDAAGVLGAAQLGHGVEEAREDLLVELAGVAPAQAAA